MGDRAYLQETYAQVAVQGLRPGGDPNLSLDYTVPLHKPSVEAVRAITGRPHRMRISRLDPGAALPEHIDDPDQVRALVLLSGRQVFRLRTRTETVTVPMRLGEVWFVNTAWHHSVTNPGPEPRLALMVDLSDAEVIAGLRAGEEGR